MGCAPPRKRLLPHMFNDVKQDGTMAQKRVIGVRLDDELKRAVEDVMKQESVDKSTAVRMLAGEGYREWRLKRALRHLREGKVSIWQASKMAGRSLWDFTDIVKKEGIEWAEFEPRELLARKQS